METAISFDLEGKGKKRSATPETCTIVTFRHNLPACFQTNGQAGRLIKANGPFPLTMKPTQKDTSTPGLSDSLSHLGGKNQKEGRVHRGKTGRACVLQGSKGRRSSLEGPSGNSPSSTSSTFIWGRSQVGVTLRRGICSPSHWYMNCSSFKVQVRCLHPKETKKVMNLMGRSSGRSTCWAHGG